MDKIKYLERQLDLCKKIAVNLKVDKSILEAKVAQLEDDLKKARAEIISRNRANQTIRNLRVLDKSDDDTGISPYDTGIRKNPWEKAR